MLLARAPCKSTHFHMFRIFLNTLIFSWSKWLPFWMFLGSTTTLKSSRKTSSILETFLEHYGLQNGAQNRAKTHPNQQFWRICWHVVPCLALGSTLAHFLAQFWCPKAQFWHRLAHILATFWQCLAPIAPTCKDQRSTVGVAVAAAAPAQRNAPTEDVVWYVIVWCD